MLTSNLPLYPLYHVQESNYNTQNKAKKKKTHFQELKQSIQLDQEINQKLGLSIREFKKNYEGRLGGSVG